MECVAVVGVVHAVVVATKLVHDNGFTLVFGEDGGGKAVFLVENLAHAHASGVFGRVDEVGNQHRHITGLLCLENLVENHLEVGVRGIADAFCGGVDVAVLQKRFHRAAVGVDVVVHDVDARVLAAGEEVDEVVHRLFQLACPRSLVVGHHRAAALEVDAQRQRALTVIFGVPSHWWAQTLPHLVDHLVESVGVDIAVGINVGTVFFGIASDDVADGLIGGFGGVTLDKSVFHSLLQGIFATT